ncbi:hypothetical protein D3C85_1845720 [compost metagenome]
MVLIYHLTCSLIQYNLASISKGKPRFISSWLNFSNKLLLRFLMLISGIEEKKAQTKNNYYRSGSSNLVKQGEM